MTDKPKVTSVDWGWGAAKIGKQFPEMDPTEAGHLDKDGEALIRLRIRGYLTDSARDNVLKKLTKAVAKELGHD